jgi:hypothetical protein
MPITPPLKIIHHPESFGIIDAEGRNLAYVYFEDEAARRNSTNRLTEPEALEVAQKIAWALSAP